VTGAPLQPPTRGPRHGRQWARSGERFAHGAQSPGPDGPEFLISPRRVLGIPRSKTSVMSGRETRRSTWNACGDIPGSAPVDDRRVLPGRTRAAARPSTSYERMRGAGRSSPRLTGAAGPRLADPHEDLRSQPECIGGAGARPNNAGTRTCCPVTCNNQRSVTGTQLEVELVAIRARARRGGGITVSGRNRLAKEVRGPERSTWNVPGEVRPETWHAAPRARGAGGRLCDVGRRMDATPPQGIPA
jgi:hypothetical protein